MFQNAHPKPVFSLFGCCAARRRLARSAPIILIIPLIWGCKATERPPQPRDLESYAAEAGAVLGADAPSESGDQDAVEASWWSVLVAVVPSGRMDDAERMLATVQAAGLPGAYVLLREGRPVIAYGRYDGPGTEQAQAGLDTVRRARVGGVTPFGASMLIPPTAAASAGSGDEFDLRGVRARLGPDAAYTLQVGVYGRGDLQDPSPEELALFRREAERAVAQLRAQGEQAFYYHGPNSSSVTVGVFGVDDHDASTMPPMESPGLRQTRERFPNNLLNGEGIMETVRTEQGPVKRLQASRLVGVPD